MIVALMAAAAFTGCKKDEKATEKELADKRWKMTAGTVNFLGQTVSVMESMDDCEKDNIWIMKGDHTNVMESGALKCDPSEPASATAGTWRLEGKTTLVVAGVDPTGMGGVSETKMDIIKSDGKTLQLKYSATIPADSFMTTPLTVSGELTYTAQ